MITAARPLRRVISATVGIALLVGLAAAPVLAIEPAATTIDMTQDSTPLGGVPFTATVLLSQVDPPGPATGATGDVAVNEGAATLDTCTLASGTCSVTLTLAAGDHTLTVSYPGDGAFQAATKDVTWTVAPNTIDASGVGLNYATFYPYKDGYRDAVTARGTRNEAASVTIKVYSPTNKLLKTAPLIPSAKGAYSWSWNGRKASGTMYPVGKYKITQTLDDGYMTNTVTKYVNLSAKRLYTYTKTLTKTTRSAPPRAPTASPGSSRCPRPRSTRSWCSPSTRSPHQPAGSDRTTSPICSKGTWDLGCASPYATIGKSYAWRKVTGSVSRNRSGTYVRLYAEAGPRSALKYGRVIVTYAVLK